VVLGYSSIMVLYLNYYRIQTFFHFDGSTNERLRGS
jgi:hypothetical protein